MPIVLVGVNHRTGPLELRERLARLDARAVLSAAGEAGFAETVALSTCNRFEVYAFAEGEGAALSARLASLVEGLGGEGFAARASSAVDGEAVRHLFEVSAGLDSLVLGESEILAQVKGAYEAARAAAVTGKFTNTLFQRALFVGKEVRTRTALAMGQTSAASVAVELAERVFGRLKDCRVLVLGAGEMAEKTVRHLLEARAGRVRIANRTLSRAQELSAALTPEAAKAGTEVSVVSWESFPDLLAETDVVLASTGAPEPVLRREAVETALARRHGRSLFLIDIAMPRDVAEDVGALDDVYLYALKDLEAIVAENLERRRGEVEKARELAGLEALCFDSWLQATLRGEQATLRRAPREMRP
ncbi:MAG: glutamyl-tRNA reductase [Elusimicrobiota bacterium]